MRVFFVLVCLNGWFNLGERALDMDVATMTPSSGSVRWPGVLCLAGMAARLLNLNSRHYPSQTAYGRRAWFTVCSRGMRHALRTHAVSPLATAFPSSFLAFLALLLSLAQTARRHLLLPALGLVRLFLSCALLDVCGLPLPAHPFYPHPTLPSALRGQAAQQRTRQVCDFRTGHGLLTVFKTNASRHGRNRRMGDAACLRRFSFRIKRLPLRTCCFRLFPYADLSSFQPLVGSSILSSHGVLRR